MSRLPWASAALPSSADSFTLCTSTCASSAHHATVPARARAHERVELRAGHELGVRRPIVRWETNRRIRAGAGSDRLRRSGHELDVQQAPPTTAHAKLRPVRDRPLGAEVQGGTAASLIDGKQFDPDFHVADGAVGIHAPLPSLSRGSRSSIDAARPAYPPRLKNCTARSCFSAAARVLNVPRFRRFPVFGFFFFEYNRYSPDLSFLIIACLVRL